MLNVKQTKRQKRTASSQQQPRDISPTISIRWTVLLCFHCIANEYYGPLEAAHAHMDDDRHDMVEWSAAGERELTLDLSDQIQGCSVALRSQSNWAEKWCYRLVDGLMRSKFGLAGSSTVTISCLSSSLWARAASRVALCLVAIQWKRIVAAQLDCDRRSYAAAL